MKFSLSAPPQGVGDRAPNSTYYKTNWNQDFIGYLIVALSVVLYVGWFIIWPVKPNVRDFVQSPISHVLLFFGLIALTIFVHELIHVAAAPNGFTSKATVIGLNARNYRFYTYIDSELSWARSIFVVAAPFLVLTVVPTVLRFTAGLPTDWVGVVAICNASLSANDLFIAVSIFLRVPRQAIDVQFDFTSIRYALKTA
ncbi:DUF3267 domain-containing protein [Roseateles sp.]|uniref:DUF3267 domain-containing protein n=1 Tax=Roseateles sp. TaxID=1971397 RepID=UPI003263C9A3